MPTYVLMTKLTPDVTSHFQDREKVGRKWKETVDRKCKGVKWLGHYFLLGPYDYMDPSRRRTRRRRPASR